MWYLICMLCFSVSLLWGQNPELDARAALNQGVREFKQGNYVEAVRLFQRAVELEPENVDARLYLGTAWMSQIPAEGAVENARSEFSKVLRSDPNNKTAIASMASMMYNAAQRIGDPVAKLPLLEEARTWYRELARVEPRDKTAYYSLGVIAWAKWYPAYMEARQKLGMSQQTPGPLPDAQIRRSLQAQFGPVIEEGIANLDQAIAIDPNYDDAYAYKNLLVRERGDLRETAADCARDVAEADALVQKALVIKKGKAGTEQRLRPGGSPPPVQLNYRPDPVYPALARQARIKGTVRFTLIIGKDGTVTNAQLISGHPLLVPAAVEAVRASRYEVTMLNGQPVEAFTQADIVFKLP
ncbi:MAG: TonB family protein [Acidobacteria bacterium]|nr:TonB family protein [Acidobacteriota bacterium]